MQCNWCHSPILEDPRKSSDGFSVHYWCIDFLEEKLMVIPGAARIGKLRQLLRRSMFRLIGQYQ